MWNEPSHRYNNEDNRRTHPAPGEIHSQPVSTASLEERQRREKTPSFIRAVQTEMQNLLEKV